MTPRLRATGLSHQFRPKTTRRSRRARKGPAQPRGLEALDLEVSSGEIVGLLGPNGSGKSTAIALLAGLLPTPSAARIELDGVAIRPADPAYRARLGVVFQHPSLDRGLSAHENLRLALRLHGVTGSEAKRRSADQLRRAGLLDRADEPIDGFSGGMRRRVDLARAFATSPDLLLMDEPTAGLDERAFRRVWEDVTAGRDAGLGIIVATHRPEEAARCDRLVALANGRVIATGTPEDLVGRVGRDVVIVEPSDAARVDRLAGHLRSLDPEVSVEGARVHLHADGDAGAQRVVDVMELIQRVDPGTVRSVTVRRPTLADAFYELAGHRLDADEDDAPAEGEAA